MIDPDCPPYWKRRSMMLRTLTRGTDGSGQLEWGISTPQVLSKAERLRRAAIIRRHRNKRLRKWTLARGADSILGVSKPLGDYARYAEQYGIK